MQRKNLSFFLKETIERETRISSKRELHYSGSIKSKALTKVLDRILSRWMDVWYNKKITNTLTAPGSLRATKEERYRAKYWETSVF